MPGKNGKRDRLARKPRVHKATRNLTQHTGALPPTQQNAQGVELA
jgi:hypothetical protein